MTSGSNETEVRVTKDFDFAVTPATYAADAVVMICFDERFDELAGDSLLRSYLRHRGIRHPDVIKRPGGVHALAQDDPDNLSQPAQAVLGQIETSLRLHQPPLAILFMHQDCGALGGSAAYLDHASEKRALTWILRRAGALVRQTFPQLKVELKLALFDGIYDVES